MFLCPAPVRHEHDEVAAFLRAKGAKMKIDDMQGAAALCEAAASNKLIELERLVINGVDPGR